MKNILALTSCLAMLSACKSPATADYANRGDPERLLTTSKEMVQIDLTRADAIDMLADNIQKERPSQAQLNCNTAKGGCKKAMRVLSKAAIPTESTGAGHDVTLVYERVMARDCDQRYTDNSSNPYNLHYESYGCSITGNMAQMVTDKRQFTDPGLLSYTDGDKAGQVYEEYSKPTAAASGSSGYGSSGNSLINAGGSSSSQ